MENVQSETQADRVADELRAAAATPSQTNLAVGKRSATFVDNSSSSNKQQRNGSPPGRHGRPGMNDTDSSDERDPSNSHGRMDGADSDDDTLQSQMRSLPRSFFATSN